MAACCPPARRESVNVKTTFWPERKARNATLGVVPACVGPPEGGRSYPPREANRGHPRLGYAATRAREEARAVLEQAEDASLTYPPTVELRAAIVRGRTLLIQYAHSPSILHHYDTRSPAC
jgi:hypothetical protein